MLIALMPVLMCGYVFDVATSFCLKEGYCHDKASAL